MNYGAHYDRLIERARGRVLTGYKECHHVIPRCMGGTDVPDNLVDLTAEEHYVAHQLLVKMYPSIGGLATAAVRMSRQCTGNKAYGWLRHRAAEHASATVGATKRGNKYWLGKHHGENARTAVSVAQKGKPKSAAHKAKLASANTGKKCSAETKARMSATQSRLRTRLGKTHTEEARQKIRAARARQIFSSGDEAKRRASVIATLARPVIHIGYGIFFDSAAEAACHFGIPANSIYDILSGRRPNRTLLRYA